MRGVNTLRSCVINDLGTWDKYLVCCKFPELEGLYIYDKNKANLTATFVVSLSGH